mmetsp:Transcript_43672/g.79680  ORF Transcript_43672/g.79680 Transcript_43672/m.79680 type:complete len:224 (-) Transcript_43672:154-825(-)
MPEIAQGSASSARDKVRAPPPPPQPVELHHFWKQRVFGEEKARSVTNRYVSHALSSLGEQPETQEVKAMGSTLESALNATASCIAASPRSERERQTFARGFPNAFNNNSSHFREAISEIGLVQRLGQTCPSASSRQPFAEYAPRAVQDRDEHPLNWPHFGSHPGKQRLVPRVHRTRAVPWGPAHHSPRGHCGSLSMQAHTARSLLSTPRHHVHEPQYGGEAPV